MPLPLQTRLLRVLAEGEILPIGADRPVRVNCRVIAATHQDLGERIAHGQFREDLYYRLNGATLRLPPLRRRADRPHVIRSVLDTLVAQGRLSAVRLRADAMSALLAYDWPGNIRQLVNALAFAEATCEGGEITANDLPEECVSGCLPPADDGPAGDESPLRRRCAPSKATFPRWRGGSGSPAPPYTAGWRGRGSRCGACQANRAESRWSGRRSCCSPRAAPATGTAPAPPVAGRC